MKFAKELEQDLVPEWRAKYLDYKLGKKKVKDVDRALKHVTSTPKTPGRRRPANLFSSASHQLPIQNRSPFKFSLGDSPQIGRNSESTPLNITRKSLDNGTTVAGSSRWAGGSDEGGEDSTYFSATPSRKFPEHGPLREVDDESRSLWDSGAMTNYGSIIASPPSRFPPVGPPSLELPDPAISPSAEAFPRHNRAWRNSKLVNTAAPPVRRTTSVAGDAYEVGRTHPPSKLNATLLPKQRNFFNPRRTFSTPDGASRNQPSPFLKRMFSLSGNESPQSPDVPLEAYKDFDIRQAQFFNFLDMELGKIESFYKMKEGEATSRLKLLRQQLHEMRDRRLEEVLAEQRAMEDIRKEQERSVGDDRHDGHQEHNCINGMSHPTGLKWIKPLENVIGVGGHHFGKNTKALVQMGSPSSQSPPHPRPDSWRDFTRRPYREDDIPYRVAKRKLKLALQEFYRGLELLKSYALLNRTAFRKINKKYDKVVKARPTGRYMSEKVNKAWFVQSEVLDGHIVAVEDLYARYFERGNHKIAVGKLRSKNARDENYSGNVFRNGLLLAAGMVFGVEGIVCGAEHLRNPDTVIQVNTSYLLQVYGGYFLALYLFLLFCLDCRVWARTKINYVFIFEFDTRHNLDWRQLSEARLIQPFNAVKLTTNHQLPCLLFFLEGLCVWLNFQQAGTNAMFLYWPVVLIGLSVMILFFPGKILYHRSRQWFAYSNFRLLLAGIYPVEFRDFFLGDMYCSLTYCLGNLPLFFCLYARGWNDPTQCNSTHSRILGFFSTLPGIWRAFQCLRRYYDTRNAFPHLVNCGKYACTILFYMTLSLYRIDENMHLKALFIVCATVNSIYTSIWDLVMDWSLCNPYAKNPFLRDVLGYKSPWMYYLAMILDPILRFNWIFYAIYSSELQHSAILSFLVGFSEVCRRGIWTLFRVENEHCTNVGRFRASRDVPLPYEIPSPPVSIIEEALDHQDPAVAESNRPPFTTESSLLHTASGNDVESGTSGDQDPSSGTLRRRPGLTRPSSTLPQSGIARVGTLMAMAHAEDFERKRRPGVTGKDEVERDKEDAVSAGSSDEDEYGEADADNEVDIINAGDILRRHRSATEEQ